MQKNPFHRLGSGKSDAIEIKNHKFFENIIWEDVLRRKLKPPKPYLMNERKYRNVDVEFSQKNEFNPNNLEGWSFVNGNAINGEFK